jgi:hypothetical protein
MNYLPEEMAAIELSPRLAPLLDFDVVQLPIAIEQSPQLAPLPEYQVPSTAMREHGAISSVPKAASALPDGIASTSEEATLAGTNDGVSVTAAADSGSKAHEATSESNGSAAARDVISTRAARLLRVRTLFLQLYDTCVRHPNEASSQPKSAIVACKAEADLAASVATFADVPAVSALSAVDVASLPRDDVGTSSGALSNGLWKWIAASS